MRVLVPIDDSDPGTRALDHGIDLAHQHEGTIEVVHYTEKRTEATNSFHDRVADQLADAGFDEDDVEVVIDIRLGRLRTSNIIGKRVLRRVGRSEADHVVMGHHGNGRVGRALLGSAAETVVRGTEVPVTVVP